MNKHVWTMATLSIAVTLIACSSSKKSPSPDAGGRTDAGPVRDAGKPDAGKSTVSKADSGTAMTMTAMPVPCGTATCQPPPSLAALAGGNAGGLGALAGLIPMVAACCLDTTMGTCGTKSAGGACMPPPKLDPSCPGVLGMMNGCCTASKQCGLDATMFAMGCVDLASVAAGPLGGFLMPPSPRACGATSSGEDAGPENDAGN